MSRFCALDLIASRSATGKLRCATINFTQVFIAPACCLFIRMARSRTPHDHKVAQVSSPRNASRSTPRMLFASGWVNKVIFGRPCAVGIGVTRGGAAHPRDTPTFEALMHALQRRIKASRSLYTCRRRTHVRLQSILVKRSVRSVCDEADACTPVSYFRQIVVPESLCFPRWHTGDAMGVQRGVWPRASPPV
jgi:hypothetical protein